MDGPTKHTNRLTREEVAHLEVGHTDVTPAVARRLTMAFLVFAAVIPLFELTRVVQQDAAALEPWQELTAIPQAIGAQTPEPSAWRALVASNRAVLAGLHGFETTLEERSRVGRLLRPLAQVALSGALGAGNEQAYIGREGWLFYRQDVEYVTGQGFLDPAVMDRRRRAADEWTDPPQPDPREAIRTFKDDLASQGIALIVVPVPVKPTVHPEKLATASPDARAIDNAHYERFVEELRREGIRVLDATGILRRAAEGGSVSQYLATDTHWRPEAMELIALHLANMVRETGPLGPAPDPGYRVEPADVSNRGDICAMLDLPSTQTLFPPEPVTIRRIVHGDGSPWRPDQNADVLLLGDSFANIYSLESMGWGTSAGLAQQLSFALGRPIDRIVQNADGAHATREELHRAGPERLKGKRVVIWQFATRELAFGNWVVY